MSPLLLMHVATATSTASDASSCAHPLRRLLVYRSLGIMHHQVTGHHVSTFCNTSILCIGCNLLRLGPGDSFIPSIVFWALTNSFFAVLEGLWGDHAATTSVRAKDTHYMISRVADIASPWLSKWVLFHPGPQSSTQKWSQSVVTWILGVQLGRCGRPQTCAIQAP